ncbi:hypothetical protein [Lentzea sp. NPDC003310]|uniref:hypothetical protein n=1 Tax=Lentzea sp. NPDC003310 TaxID=3154447 RepID=UPI0033B5F7D9
MTLRKLVYLTIAFCLVAGLATVAVLKIAGSRGDAARTEIDAAAPAFAYTTLTELVVMRGDQELTRVNRPFDTVDSLNNQVVWSNDGHFVAYLAGARLLGEDVATERLVAIDVRTGDKHEFQCPACSWIVATGTDEVLASSGSKFRRFSLGDPGRAEGTEFAEPAKNTADDYLRIFFAGTRDLVLTGGQVYLGRNRYGQKLELLTPDGKLHFEAGSVGSNSYTPAAGISGPTLADTRFAVALRNNPGSCVTDFPVKIVDAAGRTSDTEWGAAAPPGFVPNKAQGIDVRDLWWDDSRTLHATIASWTCDNSKREENSKKVLHSGYKLWKLDGRKWVLEDDGPATVVRPLAGGGRVVLTLPDCIGDLAGRPQQYCYLGEVESVRDGKRTEIATGVLRIYAPPAGGGTPQEAPKQGLENAKVPSLCGHPEGTLQNGRLPGITEHDGFVTSTKLVASADVTGDGKAETAAVFQCSQGGVAWPDVVVVYDDQWAVLGKVELGELSDAYQASVDQVEGSGGKLQVRWKSYQGGGGQCAKTWSAQLKVAGKTVEAADLTQLDGRQGAC